MIDFNTMKRSGKLTARIIMVAVFLLALQSLTLAQSKSRIIGSVKDSKTGEALVGANLLVMDTHLGAVTDVNGKFFIIAVPVGTYKVQVSMLGYRKKIMTGVLVSADRDAALNCELEPGEVEMDAVIVTAKRDLLHKEVSNTQMVVTSEQLNDQAGVKQISEYLSKQPGVGENGGGFLTIRGGSADQTGTTVNGISYNNAAIGNAETTIPLSAIDQVSVNSGGFNAEYGNFRSGLINVTTKNGSKDNYHGTLTLQKNFDHLRRFGPAFGDPTAPMLAPYLDPSVAFVGTDTGWANNPYMRGQTNSFAGWVKVADDWNKTNPTFAAAGHGAKAGDMYLLANWMFMTAPDMELAKKWGVSDSLPEQIMARQKLFNDHVRQETASDYNIDGGFGGPIPGLGGLGGTFYVSNNSSKSTYTVPVAIDAERKSTTLLTIRTEPWSSTTLTYNGMYKFQDGLSPIRPGMEGDFPDANHDGPFMPADNIRSVVRFSPSSEFGNYYFDPAFFPRLQQKSILNGITLNHVVNNSTYWEFGASYLYIKDDSPGHGDDRDTTILTNFGPFYVDEMPYGKWQFAGNHKHMGYQYPAYDALPGVSTFRFRGKEGDLFDNINVKQLRLKYDIASQLDEVHYFKAGIEYNNINIDHRFWERWNNNAYNTIELNYQRVPSQTGAYIQDQISFQWMLANIGLRADYYYGGGGVWPSGNPFAIPAFLTDPSVVDTTLDVNGFYHYLESGGSYIWDLWNKYDQAHPGFLQPVKNFFTLSPRIGVSFPLSVDSKFYFNYGYFRSNPAYYTMYMVKYRYKDGVKELPNPNLEPPRTIQYELGVAYNFFESYIFKSALYYKDVTGQAGDVTYQTNDARLSYTGYGNNDYQDIQGVELSVAKQDNSWLTGTVTFNYRLSKDGQSGTQIFRDYPIGDPSLDQFQGVESRALPQPEVTTNVSFKTPSDGDRSLSDWIFGNWRISFFGQWRTGNYFTYNPLGAQNIDNNLQWPDYWNLDLKINKSFRIAGLQTTLALECNNVLNLKTNIMGSRYAFNMTKGSTDYDDYLSSLHLPMYADPRFDALRTATKYVAGDDKPGDLRSDDKPYINDPNYPYFIYDKPRDIWVTLKLDF